ncbi:MAG: protein phosphatase 2C domain-containing protein [Oscillospiraceae bacterium]
MALLIRAAVRNDIGCSRANNEDNYYLDGTYIEKQNMDIGGTFVIESSTECAAFAVCDGMGGEDRGEDASCAAVAAIDKLRDELGERKISNVRAVIDKYVEMANIKVLEIESERAAGTTVVLLCFYEDEAFCANLGDSRLYVLRDGELVLITYDHTEASHLVSAGVLTQEQASTSVYKNVLTRYLGFPSDGNRVCANHYEDFILHYGDRFLLCSDGLTDMLGDERIRELLSRDIASNEVADLLVDEALKNGGRDNITVMIVDIEKENENPETDEAPTEAALPEESQTKLLFDDDSLSLQDVYSDENQIAHDASEPPHSFEDKEEEKETETADEPTVFELAANTEQMPEDSDKTDKTDEKSKSDPVRGLLEDELDGKESKLVIAENIDISHADGKGLLEQEIEDKKGLLEQQLEYHDHDETEDIINLTS